MTINLTREQIENAKSLLMNTAMVQATLANLKTVTRRLNGLAEINENPDEWNLQEFSLDPELLTYDKDGEEVIKVKKGLIATFESSVWGECYRNIKSPYQPGDICYVRETWGVWQRGDSTPVRGYPYDPQYVYFADNPGFNPKLDLDFPVNLLTEPFKWRSSRFMPKTAARIFLLVKDVKVERLHDITEEGALAEGIKHVFKHFPHHDGSVGLAIRENHIQQFRELWDSIYKSHGCGWNLNPWLFATRFERIGVE